MRRLRDVAVDAFRTIMSMARCSCGNCTCRGCNVYQNNPHEAEVGSNATNAAVSGGYYG